MRLCVLCRKDTRIDCLLVQYYESKEGLRARGLAFLDDREAVLCALVRWSNGVEGRG